MRNTRIRKRAHRRGIAAERWAAWFLRLKGYAILELRARSFAGEVDLVAARGNALVFIEVKARPTVEEGLYAATPAKQRQVTRAAQAYLARHPRHVGSNIRFDLIAIAPWRWPVHIEDAWREEVW